MAALVRLRNLLFERGGPSGKCLDLLLRVMASLVHPRHVIANGWNLECQSLEDSVHSFHLDGPRSRPVISTTPVGPFRLVQPGNALQAVIAKRLGCYLDGRGRI